MKRTRNPLRASFPAWGVACLVLALTPIASRQAAAAPFARGDVDGNATLDTSDAVQILFNLFLGEPLSFDCDDAADVDDSGDLNITDPLYLLLHLFRGGSAPPPPTVCGVDPTADALSCRVAPCTPEDTDPPEFGGQICTEIACEPDITMEIGSPYDMLSVDACNSCSPIPIEDDTGVARIDLQLFDATVDVDPPLILFNVTLRLSPPAKHFELGPDDFSTSELILPATLQPGLYYRRIVATDAAGNWANYDREVTLVRGDSEVVESEKARDLAPDATPQEIDELVAGSTSFALDLYQELRSRNGNLFVSPYSIATALAMTYAGARGETADQMESVLRFTLPDERLHPAFNALDLELASRGDDVDSDSEGDVFELHVANAIWGQLDFPFLGPFLDTLAVHYGAGLRVVDFARYPEPSRVRINEWVEEQTRGRIVDLLPQGVITALTRLVLTNAIYFQASWAAPFNEELTRARPFHLLDGGEVSVPTMSIDTTFGYHEGDGFQAVELPYVGKTTSMVVVMPDAGQWEAFESSLDANRLRAITDNLSSTRLLLSMPKFQFESTIPLNATLMALGMTDAFRNAVADFSGIDGSRRLFIQDVRHKAFISVDEKGTEAAAATAVTIGVVSVPPSVELNRPFFFVIRDIPTGAILFAGRVLDPTG